MRSGLALSLTSEICEKMNGKIKSFSSLHEGSVCIICLPIIPVQDEDFCAPVTPSKKPKEKLNIMVVDDAEYCVSAIKVLLSKMKQDVREIAANGLEAYNKYIKLCETGNQPDLVTLDLEMPICGGKECAKRIRDYEKKMSLKPVIIVAISANCCKSEIQETLGTPENRLANEFLKKPISFDELKKSVALCL